jgi:hypothetical protein
LFRLSHGLNLVDLNFLVFDFFSGNSLKGFILDIVLLLNLFIFRLFGSHRLLLSFIFIIHVALVPEILWKNFL